MMRGSIWSGLIVASTLALLAGAGCGSSNNNKGSGGGKPGASQGHPGANNLASKPIPPQLPPAPVPPPSFAYAMNDPETGCTTYPRTAYSKQELCRNLQVDAENNGCARAERLKFFEKNCAGEIWDPAEAEIRLFTKNDATFVCQADDLGPYGAGTTAQHTMQTMGSSSAMQLYLPRFRVLILRADSGLSRADSSQQLTAEIVDYSNHLIARGSEVWGGRAAPAGGQRLEVGNEAFGARVSCGIKHDFSRFFRQ